MTWETETEHAIEGKFNKRLFTLMGTQGHTTDTVAEAAGLSERQVWNILHGRSNPRIDTLIRICRVLHTTVDYLYPVAMNHVGTAVESPRPVPHVPARPTLWSGRD